jgi:hypothetical protein
MDNGPRKPSGIGLGGCCVIVTIRKTDIREYRLLINMITANVEVI